MRQSQMDGMGLTEQKLSGFAKQRLFAGRIGVVAGMLAFMAVYLFSIATIGIVAGIVAGWLPAATIAWLVVHAVATVLTPSRFSTAKAF